MTLPLPALLIAASSLIVLTLGSLHLLFTFRGNKLNPRDPAVQVQMEAAAPVISRETTMWKAWVGFNASHSYGAIVTGLIYIYLALVHPAFLLASPFLLGLGLLRLLAYLHLAQRYWFSAPFRGIALASLLYAAALVLQRI